MKLELGYGDEIYGTVEQRGGGLVYAGAKPDTVRRLLASMRREDGQDEATFLASLPDRLTGRVWARPVEE